MPEQPTRRTGDPDRRSLLRNGLLIGLSASAIGAASASLAGTANAASTATASTPDPQPNWWWCGPCGGLFFSNSRGSDNGLCSATANYDDVANSGHINRGSNYAVWNSYAGTDLQLGWTWCSNCQLLFWGNEAGSSACPANSGYDPNTGGYFAGPHSHNPTNYGMLYNTSGAGLQTAWYFCGLCKDIFWGNSGKCTANPISSPSTDYGPHVRSPGSYNYAMTFA
jgi:hypothetical protein